MTLQHLTQRRRVPSPLTLLFLPDHPLPLPPHILIPLPPRLGQPPEFIPPQPSIGLDPPAQRHPAHLDEDLELDRQVAVDGGDDGADKGEGEGSDAVFCGPDYRAAESGGVGGGLLLGWMVGGEGWH